MVRETRACLKLINIIIGLSLYFAYSTNMSNKTIFYVGSRLSLFYRFFYLFCPHHFSAAIKTGMPL